VFADRPELRQRLEKAVVIWLTTVSPEGQPQSSPVWFIVDGEELLVYSLSKAPRVRNIRANSRVALNLDTEEDGDRVTTMEGVARIDTSGPPANEVPAYLAKYRARIAGYEWTPESFARDYPVRLLIRPTRLRGF